MKQTALPAAVTKGLQCTRCLSRLAPLAAALLKPALARCMTSATILVGVTGAKGRGIVVRTIHPFICCITLALTASAGAAPAGDDFPLTGSYTQNVPCKGDGSDPAELPGENLRPEIHSARSAYALSSVLSTTVKALMRSSSASLPPGPMLGDVTFTMQADSTVKFVDRDQNYRSVHIDVRRSSAGRCPPRTRAIAVIRHAKFERRLTGKTA